MLYFPPGVPVLNGPVAYPSRHWARGRHAAWTGYQLLTETNSLLTSREIYVFCTVKKKTYTDTRRTAKFQAALLL